MTQTVSTGRRRIETIPKTGHARGLMAMRVIKREMRGDKRKARFRADYVAVPLVGSKQEVRVSFIDYQWLRINCRISSTGWTRGEHGEIRAPKWYAPGEYHDEYGYDYDVAALLLGLQGGDEYQMDYACSLMPETLHIVKRKRRRIPQTNTKPA